MATNLLTAPHQTLSEYRSGRETIFRSPESLRWLMRKHREELIGAGAVVYPTNRPLIVPERFDQVVEAIGERNAKARLTR